MRDLLTPFLWLLFAVSLGAQPGNFFDFEDYEGILTTSAELDADNISFGTPTVDISDFLSNNELSAGGTTVFSRNDAPSGTNVGANCSGGIGCEFPGDDILIEFPRPTQDVFLRISGFAGQGEFVFYAYDSDGNVSEVRRVAAARAYQTVSLPGALGYVIDLSGAGNSATFFIDDIGFNLEPEVTEFDCGTGDDLLDRLENDPVFFQEFERIRGLTAEYLESLRDADELGFGGEVITIPVVVHNLYNTTAQFVSDAQVQSQIDALNELFRATNPGVASVPTAFSPQVADLRIQFALARRGPDCEATTGINRRNTTVTAFGRNSGASTGPARNPIKFFSSGGLDGWPSDRYLNIWVGPLARPFGYSSWPADLATRPAEDGVVMDPSAFGTMGTAVAPFDLGHVTAHEIGHWLNLRHIWGDDQSTSDNCAGTDEVDDTPNQAIANRGCPSFPSTSCGNAPDGDMFVNQMDYTNDDCRVMFTLGQHVRAAATLFTLRTDIIGSEGNQPPPESPATPDLWSADTYDDIGEEPNASPEGVYHSADIWVRRTNDGMTNQEHQNPLYRADGSPNYVYVRVRNRGCSGSESGTVNLSWAKASSGLSWPKPWDGSETSPALMGSPLGSQPVSVEGGEFTILEFEWMVPNPADYASFGADQAHFCLLSRIEDADGMTVPETGNLRANVRNNNNIVWKNVSIGTEATEDGFLTNQIIVADFRDGDQFVGLLFDQPEDNARSIFDYGRVIVDLGDLFDVWQDNNGTGVNLEILGDNRVELFGPAAALTNIFLEDGALYPVNVLFEPFEQTRINTVHRLNLTQVDIQTGETIGGNQFWFRTFADGVIFPPTGPFVSNSPPIFVDCPDEVPTGCEFPVTVRVDMSNVPRPDNFLGNFTGILRYDPTRMEYVGGGEILSGYTGFINPQPGFIAFNGANVAGREGSVPVFRAIFRALGPVGSTIGTNLEMPTLAAATTFNDLTATATIYDCAFPVIGEQLLGDVNGDGLINSTDAALILAFAVGNPIPPVAQARIDAGIGNVDGNNRTNSRDALIILSYDVGLPVDFPLGTAVCPGFGNGNLAEEEEITEKSGRRVPVLVGIDPTDGGFRIPVSVDMSGEEDPLGSYELVARWDATRFRFVGLRPTGVAGFEQPVVNLTGTEAGEIRLAHAHPGGASGSVLLTEILLEPLPGIDEAPEPVIEVGALTAARSFRVLEPEVIVGGLVLSDNAPAVKEPAFTLSPNPSAGSTVLWVDLPEAGEVMLEAFDAQGRRVARIWSGSLTAGSHRIPWTTDGSLTAGLYLVRLRTGDRNVVRRLVIRK